MNKNILKCSTDKALAIPMPCKGPGYYMVRFASVTSTRR